jgi:predicted  nucleic acid-binding Zn-ribbon protein
VEADQLRHRLRTLPERSRLAAVDREQSQLEAELATASAERDQVAVRQRRGEQELAAVEDRVSVVTRQLYSGQVTVPRELQSMQAEIAALGRQRDNLEERVLEAMTEAEPLDARLASLTGRRRELDGEAAALRAALAETEADIGQQLATVAAERARLAGQVPDELVRLYESLRARLEGVGAARLHGGRCGGCHLSLSAAERDRIRHLPGGSLVRCEHCGRILVPEA